MGNVNGMWAFIFGDLKKDLVYFSRDRYGKKPLFFYHDQYWTIASSERNQSFIFEVAIEKLIIEALLIFS